MWRLVVQFWNKLLKYDFSFGLSSGLIPGLPRRAVLMVIASYLLLYLLIVPVFIADYRHRIMNLMHTQGALVAEIEDSQSRTRQNPSFLHNERLKRLEKVLHVRGGVFIDRKSAKGETTIWLDQTYSLTPATRYFSHHYDLSKNSLVQRLRDTAVLIFGSADRWVYISNRDKAGANDIYVVGQRNKLVADIIGFFTRATLFNILILIFTIILLRIFLKRELAQSVDGLFKRLYGDQLGMDSDSGANISRLDILQDALQTHIAEQSRLASLGVGASKLAHDIRNLLTSLQLIADRLSSMENPTEIKMGERLNVSIERALSLCEWAANYSSANRENMNRDTHRLASIVDEVLAFVRLHDPKRRVILTNACDSKVEIYAERTLIFRVLFNLSLNAVQAMQRQNIQGMLRIATATNVEPFGDDNAVEINVLDTGPGIEQKGIEQKGIEQKGIEQKPDGGTHKNDFFRTTSTGLGMAIAHDLIEWHGGVLKLMRSDAGGTHFVITLPNKETAI